jgi:signal transduction histidine kinase
MRIMKMSSLALEPGAESHKGRMPLRAAGLPVRLAGALALLLAAAVLASQELGYRADAELVARRELAIDTRLAVAGARRVALQMESAQRDYLLQGGDAEDRRRYEALAVEQAPAVQALRELAARVPIHRENLLALAAAHEAKGTTLAEVMRLVEGGDRARALAVLRADTLRDQAGRINELVEQVIRDEDEAYRAAGAERDRTRNFSRVALYSLVLLCLAAVFAALRQLREREHERARHLAALQAERDKLEGEVQRRTADLTELARHLQTVREDERRLLARELHDELGGLLTAAKLDVARVKKRLHGTPPEIGERIDHLSQTLDAGIALKRRIIEDLSPSALANLGLKRTLEIQCEEFARRAEMKVEARIDEVELGEAQALAAYRFVQEALTNIARHAGARHVSVTLEREGEHAQLQVADDGIGFDPASVKTGAHGLAGMRFRVQSFGGAWALHSSPGRGTRVQARFALPSPG